MDHQSNRRHAIALACSGLLLAGTAQAEIQYDFSGFGTLGATHSDSREADYRGSVIQPNGPGRSGSTKAGVDTKLGLQGSARFDGGFSATVQMVVDHRPDNSYSPEIEWANLKYQINDKFYVRAGRIVSPTFVVSDVRNVGYAQTSVRPPYELYMLNPITHIDGADAGMRLPLGGGTLNATIGAGRIKILVRNLSDAQIVHVTGSARNLHLGYEFGSSTLRAGVSKSTTNSRNDDISQADMMFGYGNLVGYPTPNATVRDIKTKLIDLGYTYDDGRWIFQTEYVRDRGTGPAVQDTDAWSMMLGHRIGKFTPYVAYADMKSKEPPLRYGPANAGNPSSPLYPMLSQLANGINLFDSTINTKNQQHTATLGVRYDFYKNLALKAQWDRSFKPAMSGPNRGAFTNPTASFTANSATVNLYTVVLDFVF